MNRSPLLRSLLKDVNRRSRTSTNLLRDTIPTRQKHETQGDAIAALLKNIARIERRLSKRDRPVLRDLLSRSYQDLDYLVSCHHERAYNPPALPEIGLHKPVRPVPLPRRFDHTTGTWRKIGKRRFSE